ncbi:bifunctional nicotinamidase/pyrazinamidase [Aestuariibius insulae]|uniref:bifunctional nicotinamidase/pyrazinamidase n=1 Tax=Aestuariibius insulae TaxID=2058287 RepID=UPI00345E5355
MTDALIVIDIQNDFCPGGALAVPDGDQVIGRVNAMMSESGSVILTQDWHPEEHLSFASNHPGAAAYDMTEMPYGPQVLWPDHCIIGTPGAEFHPDLRTDRADLIIRKGFQAQIDSYSAFLENDHKTPTGLHGYLQTRGLKKLTIVGLAFDFCVLYSALDAVTLGYEVTVIEGACRSIDLDGSREAALTGLRKSGVTLA